MSVLSITTATAVAPPETSTPAAGQLARAREAHATHTGGGGRRRVEAVTDRVRRDGKFFRLGADKFYVKGVTYGPFAPDANGDYFATPAQTRKDFEQILDLGANCVRIYYIPPP